MEELVRASLAAVSETVEFIDPERRVHDMKQDDNPEP